MLEYLITLGVGTPSDIPTFILMGLNPTGEIAPPTVIAVTGSYDATISVTGSYDATIAVTGEWE